MNETDTWGSWSLSDDGTVLRHEGGYGIELYRIGSQLTVDWWARHLSGKGWATKQVVAEFRTAMADLLGGPEWDIAEGLPNAVVAEAMAQRDLEAFYARQDPASPKAPNEAQHRRLLTAYWYARRGREFLARRMLAEREARIGATN